MEILALIAVFLFIHFVINRNKWKGRDPFDPNNK